MKVTYSLQSDKTPEELVDLVQEIRHKANKLFPGLVDRYTAALFEIRVTVEGVAEDGTIYNQHVGDIVIQHGHAHFREVPPPIQGEE